MQGPLPDRVGTDDVSRLTGAAHEVSRALQEPSDVGRDSMAEAITSLVRAALDEALAAFVGSGSQHPWAQIPMLVRMNIISEADGWSLVMVHESVYRRVFLDLQELLTMLLADGVISQDAHHKVMKVIMKVQREEIPDR